MRPEESGADARQSDVPPCWMRLFCGGRGDAGGGGDGGREVQDDVEDLGARGTLEDAGDADGGAGRSLALS